MSSFCLLLMLCILRKFNHLVMLISLFRKLYRQTKQNGTLKLDSLDDKCCFFHKLLPRQIIINNGVNTLRVLVYSRSRWYTFDLSNYVQIFYYDKLKHFAFIINADECSINSYNKMHVMLNGGPFQPMIINFICRFTNHDRRKHVLHQHKMGLCIKP